MDKPLTKLWQSFCMTAITLTYMVTCSDMSIEKRSSTSRNKKVMFGNMSLNEMESRDGRKGRKKNETTQVSETHGDLYPSINLDLLCRSGQQSSYEPLNLYFQNWVLPLRKSPPTLTSTWIYRKVCDSDPFNDYSKPPLFWYYGAICCIYQLIARAGQSRCLRDDENNPKNSIYVIMKFLCFLWNVRIFMFYLIKTTIRLMIYFSYFWCSPSDHNTHSVGRLKDRSFKRENHLKDPLYWKMCSNRIGKQVWTCFNILTRVPMFQTFIS